MGPELIARLLWDGSPQPGGPVPDAALLDRFVRAGDEAAFELLVWRHAALVAGVCRRVVGDPHLAEDACQAAFLVLARKAGSVRGTNLAGWLFRVARRVAVRARRQAAARARRETPLTADPVGEPARPPVECGELAAILDEEVARLPERFRLPVLLCYLGGRSTADAARALGCPRGTVLSRLATARARLAPRLARRGVGLPAGGLALAAGTPTVGGAAGAVSQVVPAAAAFACGQPTGPRPVPNSFVLAEGVVRVMSATKVLAGAAVLALAAGLGSGLGLGAGDTPQPGVAADPPARRGGAPPAADPAPPPPAAPKVDPEAGRQAVLRKLEAAAGDLAREIGRQEADLQALREKLAGDLPGQRAKLEAAEALFALDREAAKAQVVRLTKDLAVWEDGNRRERAAGPGNTPGLKARLAETAKVADELAKARAAYRELIETHYTETGPLRLALDAAGREDPREATARADLGLRREMLAHLQRQILSLRLTPGGPAAGPDAHLDEVLKELRDLRREVRELKKP